VCTKFDLVVSLLLIKRACIQNYPIFRITPTYLKSANSIKAELPVLYN